MSTESFEAKVITESGNESTNEVLVSIIMPIFNRARFLADAIASIKAQQYQNWELFIVDDGSSDNSIEILSKLIIGVTQSITIIQQPNQGPAAARNCGIKKSKGDFVAFFDSDDLWLPHHLKNCIAAFSAHPELSWVYSACERIEYDTGQCLQASTFYSDGQPNKLFDISRKCADGTYLLDTQKAILLQLNQGLDNGLQNSVLKKEILNKHLIPNYRVGEDRLFIIMALKSGFKMGFIDAIHVRYHVHDENISDTNKNEPNYSKRIESLKRLIHAKQELPKLVRLNPSELRVFKEQLSKEVFWELGYSLYQASGDYKNALNCYLKGIALGPSDFSYYKTLIISLFKYLLATIQGNKK
ncbi:glycosyltransferase [Glaciecola sp. SC05]|uniref:glycosyltransferase n=1 Tax=Glaciecola sp. SC05 TaxID=1987355 RepID=UPI003529B7ED